MAMRMYALTQFYTYNFKNIGQASYSKTQFEN